MIICNWADNRFNERQKPFKLCCIIALLYCWVDWQVQQDMCSRCRLNLSNNIMHCHTQSLLIGEGWWWANMGDIMTRRGDFCGCWCARSAYENGTIKYKQYKDVDKRHIMHGNNSCHQRTYSFMQPICKPASKYFSPNKLKSECLPDVRWRRRNESSPKAADGVNE
jgi:hypothetical protein